jgi:exonuclease-1
MDKNGIGKEIRLEDLTTLKEPSFTNFTQQMLRQLCILAGCDYLPSISGLGIKKAYTLIKSYKTIERVRILPSFP